MGKATKDYEQVKMYNDELKRQFIQQRDTEAIMPKNYFYCQFEKISEMEKELGKDCSNFTMYEIEEYYKLLNLSSVESIQCLNSQLSIYTQWCLQRNLVKDNQNHYLEMSIMKMQNCINKALLQLKIIDREMILNWCSQLPNARDQFILLALFEFGKSKNFEELWNLRPEDINGNELTLCTGRKVVVSDQLINIIYECLSETEYFSMTGEMTKKILLVDDGHVIKKYPNTSMSVSDYQKGRVIYNSITRCLAYFEVSEYMSANSIVESGKIYMVKELAKENNITPMEVVYSPIIKQVEEKYNFTIVRSKFVVKYKDYLA